MRVIYEKFVNGDTITDQELVEGIEFFDELTSQLWTLGPVFRLSAQEARRVAAALRGYQEAREEND